MNLWHDLDDKLIKEDEFLVINEVKGGSRLKYEVCKETGLLMLDRVLATATRFPCNYGFIPKTLSEDGDPCDVFILMSEAIEPLCAIKCVPIGVIEMIDNGERDEKIIAVPKHKKGLYRKQLEDISQVNPDWLAELSHFLQVYKGLDVANDVKVFEAKGKAEAKRIIKEAKALYKSKFGE